MGFSAEIFSAPLLTAMTTARPVGGLSWVDLGERRATAQA
jgi:hypothetical protein